MSNDRISDLHFFTQVSSIGSAIATLGKEKELCLLCGCYECPCFDNKGKHVDRLPSMEEQEMNTFTNFLTRTAKWNFKYPLTLDIQFNYPYDDNF